MKDIGGYFSLELPSWCNFPHKGGIYLNSGRHALEYIIKALPDLRKLYIPYFTCDVVLQPLAKQDIPYEFYHINDELEMRDELELSEGEYLLATNYFGIKDDYIKGLAEKYRGSLIVDNAQAMYAKPIEGTPSFCSPRKYCGLPDGGVAFISEELSEELAADTSYDRCSHLLRRLDEGASAGYSDFKENSRKLAGLDIRTMSPLTRRMMDGIDFDSIRQARMENFEYLHKSLGESNLLRIPAPDKFECPLVYPYRTSDRSLRERLIKSRIFVPLYWPNVSQWCDETQLETIISHEIIPLPIDQRYDMEDMRRIIDVIFE